jgi:hypothetical protein
LRALPLDDAGAAGGPASPRRSPSSRRGAGAFALASAPAAPEVVTENVLASARSSRSVAAAELVLSTGAASGRSLAAAGVSGRGLIRNPLAAAAAAGGSSGRNLTRNPLAMATAGGSGRALAGLVGASSGSARSLSAGRDTPGSGRALQTSQPPSAEASQPRSSSRSLVPAPSAARLVTRALSFRGTGEDAATPNPLAAALSAKEEDPLTAALRAATATSAKLAAAPSARGLVSAVPARRGAGAGDGRASFAAEGTQ